MEKKKNARADNDTKDDTQVKNASEDPTNCIIKATLDRPETGKFTSGPSW